jgi:hypothetical protein
MMSRSVLVAAALVAATACGGTPQPGDPAYSFNMNGQYVVEFAADDGQLYAGSMSLTTGPGGSVTGTMSLTSPTVVEGEATGTIVGAQLDLTVQYFIPDAQCGGTATTTSTIDEGGNGASGTADIANDDACAGGPTSASFTLAR